MIKIPARIKAKMPETAPILRDVDVFRGQYHSPDSKCHCLLGWVRNTFHEDAQDTVIDAIAARANRSRTLVGKHSLSGKTHLPAVNDNLLNSKKQIAKLWNDTMRLDFGYTFAMDDDSPKRVKG